MQIFTSEYSGESIVDMPRDVDEALDETFNKRFADIPKDKYGFQKGTFRVIIEWIPNDE